MIIPRLIVVDLSSIFFKEENQQQPFSRALYIKSFVTQIQSLIYTLSNTDSSVKFKLIILTHIYATMTPMNVQIEFKGGMTLMYVADLVVKFLGDKLTIEKDRNGIDNYSKSLKEELREISIKSLFDEITTTT